MYCVKFCDRLREKFGFSYRRKLRRLSRAGEGSEDSCGYCLDFLQKATKRTKVFAAAEDKAFVSFVVFCLESSPCAASTNTAGSASTSRPSRDYKIYETASNQSRHALGRDG